jgi:hypothetical protein
MQSFLFLDKVPINRWNKIKTAAKIFIKEGILLGGIFDPYFYTGAFGSVCIPNDLHKSLVQLGHSVPRNDFSPPAKVDTAVVVKDVRALRWALEQKRAGHIRRIMAGPLICTLPNEYNEALLDPGIDMLLFLSKWHRELFIREATRNIPASSVWFAGVDPEKWKPTGEPRTQILVYKKQVDPPLWEEVMSSLKECGLPYRILEYGKYKRAEYLSELSKSKFSIVLHKSETQGLASFEAWSCDTPTLHFDPRKMTYLGKTYSGTSSCPYLDDKAGIKYHEVSEFRVAFKRMLAEHQTFRPREYILNNFTLAHSVQLFLDILAETKRNRSMPHIDGSGEVSQAFQL